jgi:hypothetical protein
MFDELSRDFGSVPRGPALVHHFHVTNRTQQAVRIASIRVSCGCVTATATQNTVAPGHSTEIVAQMDTRRFSGAKTVTIYVQFDQPQWEEVRLWLQANSRDDVTVSPDMLAFGQVKRGSMATASANVTFLGSGDWEISQAKCDTSYVQTEADEVSRQAGEVVYRLTARIRSDAPVGKWYTDVWMSTNSAAIPRVRVPLTVEIESALSVSPPIAMLGDVKAGSETERKVIVRGVRPFRIIRVSGTDSQLSVNDNTSASKSIHVLTIKLKARGQGELNRDLRILTDMPEDNEIDFQASAEIVP